MPKREKGGWTPRQPFTHATSTLGTGSSTDVPVATGPGQAGSILRVGPTDILPGGVFSGVSVQSGTVTNTVQGFLNIANAGSQNFGWNVGNFATPIRVAANSEMLVSAKANYNSSLPVGTQVTITIIISGHINNVAAQVYYGSGTLLAGTFNAFGWTVILADVFTPIIGANLPGNPANYSIVTYESAQVFFNQTFYTPPYTLVAQFNLAAVSR